VPRQERRFLVGFAFVIGNFNSLGKIVFHSFAWLSL
jgi:type IV secretory pathway TrbL component